MKVTGKTKICALLGYPLGHSLSPPMQNAAFSQLGLDYLYIPWEVKEGYLERMVSALKGWENFRGGNVTIPHKERILPFMNELTPEARAIGAVNCFLLENGRLIGDNTDGKGFLLSLREAGIEPKGRRVLILGAGGAAKAVAFSLAREGAAFICLANRTMEKAEVLASSLRGWFPSSQIEALSLNDRKLFSLIRESDLIVNSTPLGMKPQDPPLFNYELLTPFSFVCDLIYNPEDTPFLEAARIAGCRTLGGLGMLLYQGALSFQLWTGKEAPLDAMRRALIEALENQQ